MKIAKSKKIIILLLILILGLVGSSVFAAINDSYLAYTSASSGDANDAMSDSVILGLLAWLVYAVGRLLEWLLGVIFTLLTGSSGFPWADKIVFNAVPLLDVNFINPSASSFLGNQYIMKVLRNTYSTVLTLALGFFGILILVTSIKLVISTMAVEKAKYKKAVVDWLTAVVLIYCIHYGMSFIFYVNEELVKVASKIALEELKDAPNPFETDDLLKQLMAKADAANATYRGRKVSEILEENREISMVWMNVLQSSDTSKGLVEALQREMRGLVFNYDTAIEDGKQYENMAMIVTWAANLNVSAKELRQFMSKLKVYQSVTVNYGGGSVVSPPTNSSSTKPQLGNVQPPNEANVASCMQNEIEKMDEATYYNTLANYLRKSDNVRVIDITAKQGVGDDESYITRYNGFSVIHVATIIAAYNEKKGENYLKNLSDRDFIQAIVDVVFKADGNNFNIDTDIANSYCFDGEVANPGSGTSGGGTSTPNNPGTSGGNGQIQFGQPEYYLAAIPLNAWYEIMGKNDNLYVDFWLALKGDEHADNHGRVNYIYHAVPSAGNSNIVQSNFIPGEYAGEYVEEKESTTANTLLAHKNSSEWFILTNDVEEVVNALGIKLDLAGKVGDVGASNFKLPQLLSDMVMLKESSGTSSGKPGQAKIPKILTELGQYFRENSFVRKLRNDSVTTAKKSNEIIIPNAIMYAVFVVQSLMLFIAYIKRLFYIIILAMLAPVVVVFDFFQKFGK